MKKLKKKPVKILLIASFGVMLVVFLAVVLLLVYYSSLPVLIEENSSFVLQSTDDRDISYISYNLKFRDFDIFDTYQAFRYEVKDGVGKVLLSSEGLTDWKGYEDDMILFYPNEELASEIIIDLFVLKRDFLDREKMIEDQYSIAVEPTYQGKIDDLLQVSKDPAELVNVKYSEQLHITNVIKPLGYKWNYSSLEPRINVEEIFRGKDGQIVKNDTDWGYGSEEFFGIKNMDLEKLKYELLHQFEIEGNGYSVPLFSLDANSILKRHDLSGISAKDCLGLAFKSTPDEMVEGQEYVFEYKIKNNCEAPIVSLMLDFQTKSVSFYPPRYGERFDDYIDILLSGEEKSFAKSLVVNEDPYDWELGSDYIIELSLLYSPFPVERSTFTKRTDEIPVYSKSYKEEIDSTQTETLIEEAQTIKNENGGYSFSISNPSLVKKVNTDIAGCSIIYFDNGTKLLIGIDGTNEIGLPVCWPTGFQQDLCEDGGEGKLESKVFQLNIVNQVIDWEVNKVMCSEKENYILEPSTFETELFKNRNGKYGGIGLYPADGSKRQYDDFVKVFSEIKYITSSLETLQ
jgi:hypothetical protein